MNNQPTAFFFQIQPIPDDTILFDQFQQQNIFYSYFQVEQKYYLFFYSQKSIDIDLIEQFIDILEELDTKQRKIRSLRGFFLYALEIIQSTDNYQILKTNLKPSFWRNLRTILRQNKKIVLLQFLFGRGYSSLPSSSHLEDQIQTLQNQVDSLHQKIIELESKLENPKYALSEPSQPLESSKTIQHDNSTMNGKKGPYLTQNENEIRNPAYQTKDLESKSFSEDSKIDFKTLSHSQQYNISSNEEKGRNRQNFVTLGKISDEEKIEIIKLGFQLQNEGKISLKKYYESTDPYSLSQFNGYSIKYESIRRTKFYQQLKLSNN